MTATGDAPLPPLPHAGPARLVTRVVRWDRSEIVCEGRIPAGSPWIRDGRCPAFVLLELAAQAAAALDALRLQSRPTGTGGERQAAGPGAIVRVRDLIVGRPTVQPDRPLFARVTRAAAAPPLFHFAVQVDDDGGREVLRAELGLHLPEARPDFERLAP